MPDASDHSHVATNGRAELSLNDLAELHGGLAPWMMLVSERSRRCYHAAKAGNARLAKFQLSETIKLLRSSVKVRPQYAEAMEKFITEDLGAIRKILDEENWAAFDAQWDRLTVAVNDSHEEFNHGFLVWKVDPTPPGDLDLTPQPKA
jgi:hypothetical protein